MRNLCGRSLLIGLLAALPVLCQQLRLRLEDDQLRASAPGLHFLAGKPLESLRNGSTVAFDFHLAVVDESRSVIRRAFERFVISYDLWEEKFSATRMKTVRSSASRLSASAAEAWCVGNVPMLASGLPEDKKLYFRLTVQVQPDRRQPEDSDERASSLPLSSLIDIFSGAAKPQSADHWRAEIGPLLMRDLRKGNGKS